MTTVSTQSRNGPKVASRTAKYYLEIEFLDSGVTAWKHLNSFYGMTPPLLFHEEQTGVGHLKELHTESRQAGDTAM